MEMQAGDVLIPPEEFRFFDVIELIDTAHTSTAAAH